MMGNVVGRFVAKNLGKRWYFLIGDYAWGWQNYDGFSRVLKAEKGENLGVSPILLERRISRLISERSWRHNPRC